MNDSFGNQIPRASPSPIKQEFEADSADEIEEEAPKVIDAKSWQIKVMSLFISLMIIAESTESMLSLTYFKKDASVDETIQENNSWLTEKHDYESVPFDDSRHPTRNQANLFLMKYSEFSSTYY